MTSFMHEFGKVQRHLQGEDNQAVPAWRQNNVRSRTCDE